MRITTGKKVEVWTTEAATNMGAWRTGEVISGNGHSYVIKWFDGGPNSARIPRKFVRPIPEPEVRLPKDLVPGDIVEVFDSNLWKWAEVVRVGDDQFSIKFIGSTEILTADRTALRPRLMYGEEGWALIHKSDKIPIESAVPSRPIAGKNIKLGKTKRSNCPVDADVVRDVKRLQGNGNTKRFFAKEDPVARYHNNVELMDVHASHYLKKKHETGNNVDCFLAGITDSENDNDVSSKSDTSSSTSDSSSSNGSSGSNKNDGGGRTVSGGGRAVSGGDQEAESQLQSSCNDVTESHVSARVHHHRANEVQVVMKQDEEKEHDRHLHALEMEAYVNVMKAFHATGSLTWSREKLLTNLRLHLHISSDEHLQIIWRLNGKKKPAGGPRNGYS